MTRSKAAPFNGGSNETNLGSRYGEIGIPAVTAALQFKSRVTKPGRLQTRRGATAFRRASADVRQRDGTAPEQAGDSEGIQRWRGHAELRR